MFWVFEHTYKNTYKAFQIKDSINYVYALASYLDFSSNT